MVIFTFFGEMLKAYDWMTDLTESTNQKSEKFKKVGQKSKMITSFFKKTPLPIFSFF